jgi:hypothetical protein
MRAELIKALKENDNRRTRNAAVVVMRWGGVVRGNVSWLTARQNGLAQLLKEVRAALHGGDVTREPLASPSLRFNAGMTKVYSLICNDFIIYDSRVAAALAWMVARFQKKTGADPASLEGLRFALPAHKESATAREPKRRNPSNELLTFPRLAAGSQYAAWNLKANWLLNAVLDHPNARESGFAKLGDRRAQLRALEAALFMLGYDLPEGEAMTPAAGKGAAKSMSPEDEDSTWEECFTIAKGKRFFYDIEATQLATTLPGNGTPYVYPDEIVNRTLSNLRVLNAPDGVFVLGNSADDVESNEEKNSLGCAYTLAISSDAASAGVAPRTSRLGAMLVELGVFVPPADGKKRDGDWQLKVDAPGLLNAEGEFDIRACINAWLSEQDGE